MCQQRSEGEGKKEAPPNVSAFAHLENHLVLQNLRASGRDLVLHLADLLLDRAVRVELRLELAHGRARVDVG